jgi:nucleoside-diphosphate-sugar epimerase
MRVLLAGASGTLGLLLTRRLLDAGHEVTGLTRSDAGAARLADTGATVLTVDLLQRDALLRAVDSRSFDAVLHEATALSKPPLRHRDMAATNALRTTGTTHLLEAAEATGARRFVTQSIVFGYGYSDHGATLLTEESPFGVPQGDAFDPHLAAMVSTERQVTQHPRIEGIALRYGLFYGADLDAVEGMLRRRALPIVRRGGAIPFVHHRDAADATVAALERGIAGRVYNVVDDTPATFADLARGVAAARGTPRPLVVPRALLAVAAPYGAALFCGISMRVSNARAREDLAWRPAYPSIADGIAGS